LDVSLSLQNDLHALFKLCHPKKLNKIKAQHEKPSAIYEAID